MKQKKKQHYYKSLLGIFTLLLCIGMTPLLSYALGATGNVTNNGQAFSTNYMEQAYQWYSNGYTVSTGVTGTPLQTLEKGQHYYANDEDQKDVIDISHWTVAWSNMSCCHGSMFGGGYFEGFSYEPYAWCERALYSGYLGYCADCGEVAKDLFVYMSDGVAKTITSIDQETPYFYACPWCVGLQQGATFSHECKSTVSNNKYFIEYASNGGNGWMPDSICLYNNATEYNGESFLGDTQLSSLAYTRTSYAFVGWNTMPDGSGDFYADGALMAGVDKENMTEEHNGMVPNLTDQEQGVVTLYAQWEAITHSVEIDPNGGSYEGSTDISTYTKDYGETQTIGTITTTPDGPTISFNTMGGNELASLVIETEFDSYELNGRTKLGNYLGFQGEFSEPTYKFTAGYNGYIDVMTASYKNVPSQLPVPTKDGFLFAGWYSEETLDDSSFVGTGGDLYTPNKDITLYAKWSSLQLLTELPTQIVNGISTTYYNGTINATWFWSKAMTGTLTYEYYIANMPDGIETPIEELNWSRIYSNSDGASEDTSVVDGYIFQANTTQRYTIPASGFYTLTIAGASGADIGGYTGGDGYETELKVWLKKDEVLVADVGSTSGTSGGDSDYKGGAG